MRGAQGAATDAGAPGEGSGPGSPLEPWEAIAVDAVGEVIEFWGFKRNQGRVWALLYLRDAALSAGSLERELGLSKGAVSMLVRDLERWGVVVRERGPGSGTWRYRAETHLLRMVTRVVEEREAPFLARVRARLLEAERLGRQSVRQNADRVGRLAKMSALAGQLERALRLFIKSARLDVGAVLGALR